MPDSTRIRIVYPEGYDEFDGLSQAKGWVQVEIVAQEENERVCIYFVTPERLAQDASEMLKSDIIYYERNLVFVSNIERATIEAAVRRMFAQGIFGPGLRISDLR